MNLNQQPAINYTNFFSFPPDCSTVLEIALNPTALEENNKGDEEVCMLALNFARQQYGLRLSEEYTVVSCSPKSSHRDLYQRLGYQQWPNAPREPNTGRAGRPCVCKLLKAPVMIHFPSRLQIFSRSAF